MKNNPAFYKKDIKSTLYIENTRKELIKFNDQSPKFTSFNHVWNLFCSQLSKERLKSLGKDIANKKERVDLEERLKISINRSLISG